MARIPDAEVERLKNEVSLQRLVEARGIELRRHGADLIGRCPFHDDRTPSLVVSPAKNLWHCLGACGTGGSVIDWVMKAEGVSFRHAVELLRADAGLSAELPKGRGGRMVAKKSTVAKLAAPIAAQADDAKLLGQVVTYYHEALKESPEALAYLEGRGLRSAELVERFRLGFANRTLGYRLPQKNRQAGAELRGRLQALGVLRESGHEHFNGSLVVPIHDEDGNVVQMYGRKVTAGLRPGTAQHLYLPGPQRGVWNLEALQADREIILCESLIDAMTFWCAGLRNVTTSYGVNGFTEEHLQAMIRHFTRRVLIAYDRDAAGDAAAEKLAARLSSEGLAVYRVQFPKGMDANEYAQKMKPADKALELVIRRAVWLAGTAPTTSTASSEAVATAGSPATTGEDLSPAEMAAAPATPAATSDQSSPAVMAAAVKATAGNGEDLSATESSAAGATPAASLDESSSDQSAASKDETLAAAPTVVAATKTAPTEEVRNPTSDEDRLGWRRPGTWPWDAWQARAMDAGVSEDLALLGAEVMREATQHAWPAELVERCWGDDGAGMIAQALTDAGAQRLWHYWLESDGGRGYIDERGEYVWFDAPVLDPDEAERAREQAELDDEELLEDEELGDESDDEPPEPRPPAARPSLLTAPEPPANRPAPAGKPTPTPPAPPARPAEPSASHPAQPSPSRPTPSGVEPATPAVPMETGEHEVNFRFGERRVRIRGLSRNKSYDQLKVNILVGRGEAFFVDTVDLYHARQRAAFLGQAADELKIAAEVLKKDLGQVLLSLEALQEQAMADKLSPKTSQVVLSGEEKAEALELLRDPKLCDRIVADFARCGVVGEETNKLVGYIAAVSRKLAEPLAVIVQSSSAAGKSSLMDAVLAFVPEEERVQYSAMTGQSLYYLGETELSHKLLAIVEEEGAERASYALKLLQSEGELTIASTGKDPQTGKLVTNEYRVMGPVMIFLTTTAIEIDEELLNRCLVLTVDEGAAQTAAIHERQRHSRTLAGLLGRRDKDSLLRVHQNAQRLLRRLPVVNPYAEKLTFAAHKTRMRRDHMKYLALIETIALLHQYQREVKTVVHGGETIEYIEVTRADIAVANRLAHQVLGRTLDELPPQTRRLLGLLDELVQAACLTQGIERSEFRFSRRQVREYTEWGNTQVRVHLARLVEMEYVLVHRGSQGQGYVYELCHDGRGPGGEPRLSGLTDAETLDGDASMTTTSRGLNTTSRGSEGHFAGGVRPVSGVVAGRERRAESARASSNSASSGRNGGPSGAPARQGARPNGPSYTREPVSAAPPVSAAAPPGAVLEA